MTAVLGHFQPSFFVLQYLDRQGASSETSVSQSVVQETPSWEPLDPLDTTMDSRAPLQTHRIRIGGVVPRNSQRYTKSTGNAGAPQFENPCFWSSCRFSSFPENQVLTLSEHWSSPKESSLHMPRFLPWLENRLAELLSVEEKSGY